MALTAEQHEQLAVAYEKAAADFLLPPEKRAELEKKADWFRSGGARNKKREACCSTLASVPYSCVEAKVKLKGLSLGELPTTTVFIRCAFLPSAA